MTSDAEPVWNEEERLAALHRTRLLDTPPEQAIDDLVRMTAELLDMPMAAVHLIDSNRQWGLSELGLGVREMPRDVAFCAHTILGRDIMVVPDAALDPRFAANPWSPARLASASTPASRWKWTGSRSARCA